MKTEAEVLLEEEAIIKANKGLVYKQLHKFYLAYDEEAVSIAFIALLAAVRSFDKSKGIKFSTYATVCIYNRLGDYIRRMKEAKNVSYYYYDAPSALGALPLETITNPNDAGCVDPSITLEKDERTKFIYKSLYEIRNGMKTDYHKRVFDMWVASEFEISQAVIAAEVNVSQTMISQVLRNIRVKLKEKLEEYDDE